MAYDQSKNFRSQNDLGLSGKADKNQKRAINKDGTFNVRRYQTADHFYHRLLTMSWTRFFLLMLSLFLIVNCMYATIYILIGIDKLGGVENLDIVQDFLSAFFFSAQTMTTVGYGAMHPVGVAASTMAAIESLTGLLGFAIATGLMYGRFTRPSAGIRFTEKAIIAPYKEGLKSFQFRLANERNNHVFEPEVLVIYTSLIKRDDGKIIRNFLPMKLELSTIYFLSMNWTIAHPINEESPLFGKTKKDLLEEDAEILVLLKLFNDAFAQTVYTRTSFKATEIDWDVKYVLPYNIDENGNTHFYLEKLDETISA